MSVHVTGLEDRTADAGDLADLWLGHALGRLLEACGAGDVERDRAPDSGHPAGGAASDEAARHDRLEASRSAAVYAALALETRINRVLGCFDARCEVDAEASPGSRDALTPSRARAMVEVCSKICSFLATLAGEGESETARRVERVAEELTGRAEALSISTSPGWYDEWDSGTFPPTLVGS